MHNLKNQKIQILKNLTSSQTVVYDLETTGLNPYSERIAGVALLFPETGYRAYLGLEHGCLDKRRDKDFKKYKKSTNEYLLTYANYRTSLLNIDYINIDWQEEFKEAWNSNPNKMLWGYNTKFDNHFMENNGYHIGSFVDVMAHVQMVFEDWSKFVTKSGEKGNRELKWQAQYWGLEGASDGEKSLYEALDKWGKLLSDSNKTIAFNGKIAKGNMWRMPSTYVAPYALKDVELTWALAKHLMPIIEQKGHIDLLHDTQQMIMASYILERNGLHVDVEDLKQQEKELKVTTTALEQEVSANYGININSPIQVAQIIGTESANRKVLEVSEHPLASIVLDYRQDKKVLSTYVESWLAKQEQGLVHGVFNPLGTVSGRWSSREPNIQNIPNKRTHLTRCVVPRNKGWKILAVDYKALEMYLASYVAKPFGTTMLKLLANNIDAHSYTKEQANVRGILYGTKTDNQIAELANLVDNSSKAVESHIRFVAKTMNFSLLYGGGKFTLSSLLKISEELASPLVYAWRELYPEFPIANKYYQTLALKVRAYPNGGSPTKMYIETPYGRIRSFHPYPEVGYRKKVTNPITNNILNEIDENLDTEIKEEYAEPSDQWEEYPFRKDMARKGFNNVVQGWGGYITAMSLVELIKELKGYRWIPFAMIHDAIDAEVHPDDLEYIMPIYQKVMTSWDITPKLKIVPSWGDNWLQLEEIQA
jgi:DNA polymerase I-like protein with 3'-5' exonuclease and polymerase domains